MWHTEVIKHHNVHVDKKGEGAERRERGGKIR